MKTFFKIAVFFLLAVPAFTGAYNKKDTKPVRVLLITGFHDFEKQAFYTFINSLKGITISEVKHPDAHAMFRPENRSSYDVILLYDMPEIIGEEARKDFSDCLKAGKGLVVWHHAYCSYQSWPEYTDIVGGRYQRQAWTDDNGASRPASDYKHDVKIKEKVADKKHPITKGIKDFEIIDETYSDGYVKSNVHILLTTDDPGSTPSLAWTNRYGKSKVASILLGHDNQAWSNPDFAKLLNQAIFWVKP
jgi:type 1 glutamine amidotransferase